MDAMAQAQKMDEYDMWRDRALDEVTSRLDEVRAFSREEFASHAQRIIGDVVNELVQLALVAEAQRTSAHWRRASEATTTT